MIGHWLNVELWGPLWPNVFAPSVWVLPAVVISHVKAARQRERHHAEMKWHVSVATGRVSADRPADADGEDAHTTKEK